LELWKVKISLAFPVYPTSSSLPISSPSTWDTFS